MKDTPMKLTESQYSAIEHVGENLQLIACAGSGKTEVVAQRVVHLLGKEDDLGPRNIVAFTFTNKAAAELKERIAGRAQEHFGQVQGLAEMFVGTIHAFCLDLLKEEVPQYLKYEVLNEVQQVLFVDRYSRKSGLTASSTLAGQALKRFTDTGTYIRSLDVLREARLARDVLADCSVWRVGLPFYLELLDEHSYLDFSAVLCAARDTLSANAAVRRRLKERIRYVIVDEYQDVNPVQEEIVALLHDLGAKICVVGDDDQTIYQWRGSDVRNILSFDSRYPAVDRINLDTNFRSSEGVVETARKFIEQNGDRIEKAIMGGGAQNYEAGDIVAQSFDSPQAEATYIARTMRELHGVAFRDGDEERGLAWSDMAILLRSVKNSGGAIVEALAAEGIPYIVTGMTGLFDTPEAQAARDLFHLFGDVGNVEVDGVVSAWIDADLGLDHDSLDAAVRMALSDVDEMFNAERWVEASIQKVFLDFLERAGVREEAAAPGRSETAFFNLGKFSQVISDFEMIHYRSSPQDKYQAFAKFLTYKAKDAYSEGWQDNHYSRPDAVEVMTVHQAKGAQWPVVFIPALLKNRFPPKAPGGRTVWHLVPAEGVERQERYTGTIEDERRLFYVAMTRSQKFLHLTWAPHENKNLYKRVSPFWENILVSRYVKRRPADYSVRQRLDPAPRRSVEDVIFSFTDLKHILECPYRFKLGVLWGFNPPVSPRLGFGKSLHDALAEVHARAIRAESVSVDDVSNLVDTHLHTPYAPTKLAEDLKASASRIVRKYIEDNAERFSQIEFSEQKVEIILEGGITVNGRIDLVRRLDTGETTIVDLKSSERAQAEDVTDLQLHTYALGYRELTGRDADYVETYELDEGNRKPRSVDEEFMTDVIKKTSEAADSLRAGEFAARPERSRCKSCDQRPICSAGCLMMASKE